MNLIFISEIKIRLSITTYQKKDSLHPGTYLPFAVFQYNIFASGYQTTKHDQLIQFLITTKYNSVSSLLVYLKSLIVALCSLEFELYI